jgi:hypothetical protein
MPEHNYELPYIIEKSVEQAGRIFMKELFRLVIERADAELVLSKREGKQSEGIQRIGKRPYSFKTRFGKVTVRRIRIRNKADGYRYHLLKLGRQASN